MNLFKRLVEKAYLSFEDNLVYYDSTTHCKSRYYYDNIAKTRFQNEECYVVYIDINNLKKINDNYGHYKGTELIRNISKALLSLKHVHEVCRVGGDEFLLICDKEFDPETLKHIEDISYGVVYKKETDELALAEMKADKEMYKMKQLYKNKKD